jgi:hypothetical protein
MSFNDQNTQSENIELPVNFHEDDFYYYRAQYKSGINFLENRDGFPNLKPYAEYGTKDEKKYKANYPIPEISLLLQSLPYILASDYCELCESDNGETMRASIKQKFEEIFEKNKEKQKNANKTMDLSGSQIMITDNENKIYTYIKSPASANPKIQYSILNNKLNGYASLNADVSDNIYRKKSDNQYVNINTKKICNAQFADCQSYTESDDTTRSIDNLVKSLSSFQIQMVPNYDKPEYIQKIEERDNIFYDAHTDKLVEKITEYYMKLCENKKLAKQYMAMVGDGDELSMIVHSQNKRKLNREYLNLVNMTLGIFLSAGLVYKMYTHM